MVHAVTDSRRSILFLIPSLKGGGAERVVVTLLGHLDRSRFRLTLAVVDMRDAAFRADLAPDVECIDLNCSRVRHALPKLLNLIWQRRPDVVLSTLGHLNLLLALLRPFLPGQTRYLARETSVVSENNRSYRFPLAWALAYRYLYRRFDCVVCQSQDMAQDLHGNFGLPRDKMVIINNPVDSARIHALASERVPGVGLKPVEAASLELVAAGRLTAQKGFDLLIEALAQCSQRSWHLTILGEGPLKQSLQALAIQRGIAAQIDFAGFQKNPYPFFLRADAFVLCSRFEGFSNVVLEALACGTPVIATPAPGGVNEVLEGLEGCVIADAVSVEALARAIRGFVKGIQIPAQVVAPYAVDVIVRRYEELFL